MTRTTTPPRKETAMVTMSRRRIGIVIVVALSIIVLTVVGVRIYTSKFSARTRPPKSSTIPVAVAPVVMGEIRRTVTFPADLHAQREATVYCPVDARVVRYDYREGDEVAKGRTLVVLDREEKWNKYKPLLVEAPISGRVAEIYLQPGEFATSQTPLCLVIGGKAIRALLSVPDPDLRIIRPSMEAILSVPTIPEKDFPGTVAHVTPFIQSDTRTGQVEVVFTNDDYLLMPGMYGSVTITIDRRENAPIIPLTAVVYEETDGEKAYVFVIDGDRAQKRDIDLGILEDKRAEVTGGLREGERVVTIGKENLSDASPVVVVEDR